MADSVSGSAQRPHFLQEAVVVKAPELHGAPADALQGGRTNYSALHVDSLQKRHV
jgi:hypothetical protein